MALIGYCWLIIESFVVPHGFLKWFYLSFYIHPVFLVFCQVFLWLNELIHHLTGVFRLCFLIFRLTRTVVLASFSYLRPAKVDVFYDALEPTSSQGCEVVVSPSLQIGYSRVESTSVETVRVWNLDATFEVTEEMNHVKDSWLDEFLNSDRYTSSVVVTHDDSMSERSMSGELPSHSILLKSSHEDEDEDEDEDSVISPSISATPDSLTLGEQLMITNTEAEHIDPFHHKYASRMRFFDILYHERLQGINAISNEHLSSPSFFNSVEASTDYPAQYKVWSRVARKRLLRSLECDIEMICVAQCCLFWEALHHQYHKVESFTSSDINILFEHEIAIKFQEVQILLERFVEDERCECQGSSNNINGRLAFQSRLLVPDATGFVVTMRENRKRNEEHCISPSELLEGINNSIEAFWSYIRRDAKKSFWELKGILRTHSAVEDPQDLQLLYDVMKILDKKWLMVRGVEGKSKCWVRRKVKPMQEEDEKRNLVFATIDVKLVQTLLKMPLISKSHLKWCQHKLENIEFKQQKLCRGRITHLFPSS